MEESSYNDIPWFLRFAFTLNIIYQAYKKYGFIEGTKTIYTMTKISLVMFFYNHCKWFRNRVRENARKLGAPCETLVDMVYTNRPIDLKEIVNSDPSFKQYIIDNFDETKEKVINNIITRDNITDEEEIAKLRDSIKLEDYI